MVGQVLFVVQSSCLKPSGRGEHRLLLAAIPTRDRAEFHALPNETALEVRLPTAGVDAIVHRDSPMAGSLGA